MRPCGAEPANACDAVAFFGAQAFHMTIGTRQAHRRDGLARQAAAAFLRERLADEHPIYWIMGVSTSKRCAGRGEER